MVCRSTHDSSKSKASAGRSLPSYGSRWTSRILECYVSHRMSAGRITSSITISAKNSTGFQTKLPGRDLGLRVSVRDMKSSFRTTSFYGIPSQPMHMVSAVQEDCFTLLLFQHRTPDLTFISTTLYQLSNECTQTN